MAEDQVRPSGGPVAAGYEGYEQWKSWTGNSEDQRPYFASEFSDLHLSGAKVLEIGFGDGELLRWLRGQGAATVGLEIISELVRRETTQGFTAYVADHFDWEAHEEAFDVVFAMDVFEHLSFDGLEATLRKISCSLRPGGLLIVRSPNMTSPFGLVYQYSDPTHILALSPPSLSYVAKSHGLGLVSAGNPRYPRAWSSPLCLKTIVRALVLIPIRRAAQLVIGLIFFDGKPFPMDPNFVARYRKDQSAI